MSKIVVVEGSDLVGKSTIAEELFRQGFRSLDDEVANIQDTAKNLKHGEMSRMLCYLASNFVAFERNSDPLVRVRHIWSTIAYFCAEANLRVDDVYRDFAKVLEQCPQPDGFVLVTASLSARLKRMQFRSIVSTSDRMATDVAFSSSLDSAFLWLAANSRVPVLHIDTTDEPSSEEVGGRLLSWLDKI